MNSLMRLSVLVWALSAARAPQALGEADGGPEFPLHRLDVGLASCGSDKALADAGARGRPPRIGGEAFKNGLITHAPSDFHVRLFKSARRLKAAVGAETSAGRAADKASIEFVVRGDGRVLWRSGLMRRGDAPRRLAVDLTGVDRLTLEVTDGGDGKRGDFAAWADAVITAAGRAPVAVPPTPEYLFGTLDPFYKQHVSVGGLLIAASDKPSPYALKEAAYLVEKLLAGRRDILDALVRNRVRVGVMAYNEMTTAIPAHRTLGVWYDKRARGLGGNPVTCGEENLLGFKGDPYRGENIFIHEFAHIIDGRGLRALDKAFWPRVQALHASAKKTGRFRAYGMGSPGEFWAEGVQSWFNCNRRGGLEAFDSAGKHVCSVNTRTELKKHMPEFARFLAGIFRGNDWTYMPVLQRLHEPHLKGYDPAGAPTFTWPKHVIEGARKVEAAERAKKKK